MTLAERVLEDLRRRGNCRECGKLCRPYQDLEISIRWGDEATEIVVDGCWENCVKTVVYCALAWALPLYRDFSRHYEPNDV